MNSLRTTSFDADGILSGWVSFYPEGSGGESENSGVRPPKTFLFSPVCLVLLREGMVELPVESRHSSMGHHVVSPIVLHRDDSRTVWYPFEVAVTALDNAAEGSPPAEPRVGFGGSDTPPVLSVVMTAFAIKAAGMGIAL
jgi:hypothetical protein